MTVTIRLATPADVEVLFDIRTSVVQNHLSREQLAALGITAATLADAMRHAPCCWIAQVHGAPAGFAMVDVDDGEVFALFIRPTFEGRGLGQALLDSAEACLFQTHEVIGLTTDGGAAIRANGFYIHQGWTLVGAVDERDVRYEKRRALLPPVMDDPRW